MEKIIIRKFLSLFLCFLISFYFLSCTTNLYEKNHDSVERNSDETQPNEETNKYIPTNDNNIINENNDLINIKDLTLKNLLISDAIIDHDNNEQYVPMINRGDSIIDVEKVVDKVLGDGINPQTGIGYIYYNNGKRTIRLYSTYDREIMEYIDTDLANGESSELIEMDKNETYSMANTILDVLIDSKENVNYDKNHSYTNDTNDQVHRFKFDHKYKNELVIDDITEGITISVAKKGIRDFTASLYQYQPANIDANLLSIADMLIILDDYIQELSPSNIPISATRISLVYSNLTEFTRDTSMSNWNKYTLHWKVQISINKGEYQLDDSFYINCIDGSIYFTSNSL